MKPLLGTYRENIVSDVVRKKRNRLKNWAYGYHEDYDIIVVSKDGTLGSIYEMEGILIGLPEKPTQNKHIINGDVTVKSKQKWERKPLPLGLNRSTRDNHLEYIDEEFRRRKEGVWIKINGEVEYFPGCYYFFLQWFNIKRNLYPHFRYTQKDLMLFWEACYADQRSYGILYVKNRRLGWSTIQQSECCNRGTLYRDGKIGIISKTGKDAKSHFKKVVNGFKKMPFFFQPQTEGSSSPKTELVFTKPSKRITHKTQLTEEDQEDPGLNTEITWYNTDLNAMDSEAIVPIQIIDEPGKFPKQVPFSEYWDVAKECLVEGDEVIGSAMVGSTINPPEKGGNEFKIVWDASETSQRDGNGETISGLYRIFIPAEYNIRGYFDEWGFPITDDAHAPFTNNEGRIKKIGASKYLDNKEDSLVNDPEKLNARKRKYPRTITDAFRGANNECAFSAPKLYEQLDYIERDMPITQVQTGNLQWVNGIPDTTVKFVPDPNGKFNISWQPPKEIRNNFINSPYGKKPGNAHLGAFGCDPYNRGKTSDGRGSDGAIHGLTKDNYVGVPSNYFFMEYLARPKKVELFYEDMILAMVYYGMPALIEQSNDEFLKLIKRRGYRPFMLTKPGVAYKDLNPTEKELGGIPQQSTKTANAQFYAVEAYITDFVGYADIEDNRPVGEIGKMWFKATLQQWLETDPENRTKYDAYISSSLAIIANQRRIIKKETTTKQKFTNPLATYSNKGAISKRAER